MSDEVDGNDQGYSLASIQQIANGDESFVQTLVDAFQTEAEEISQGLKEALSNRNIEQINRLAHKIKPTLQQFEMTDLHQQSLELEKLKQEEEMKTVEEKVETFIEALQEMKEKI